MIYVLTGNGKGKTTCAIGMGIRAIGAGQKVLTIQFLKTGDSSEIKVIEKIKNFEIRQGRLDFFKKAIKIGKYNLLILDEVNVATGFGLIGAREVLAFLKKYGKKLDIVLTGRYCPKEIIKAADLVTEFKEVKHYFKKGIKARKGIEY